MALATLIKLWLAWKTQGTLDIPAYQDHLDKIRQFGVAAYGMPGRFGNPFNIPPFALHVVQLAEFLADKTGVPFGFWFRLPGVAADAGSVWLAWKIVSKSEKLKLDPAALLLMALCPASITIAGFHGNLDPIMVFFVLLSLFLLVNNRSMGWAAAAFGMAMNIKVAPLLFAPSLFFYLPNLRARLLFFSRAFAVCLAGSLPYVIENPLVIATAVLGHAGMYSHWGWSLLLVLAEHRMPMGALSGFHPPGWHGIIAVVAKYLVLILVVIISYWMNRKRPSPHLFVQFGAVAFLFMFLTPGFGAQISVGWFPGSWH